jgi:hypothetical protein
MLTLSANDLLQIWEWGQGQAPLHQALVILATAYPSVPPEQLAGLPIGQRDAQLLQVRSHTFGSQLQAVATCPSCSEALEFGLAINDLTVTPIEPLTEAAPLGPRLYHWYQEDYQLTFRLPTSADLLSLSHFSPEQAQEKLLQRCLQSLKKAQTDIPTTELPTALRSSLEIHMAQQDPQADLQLNLCCPACRHQWLQLFDIVSFLWREIASAAQRLLQEVHLLASVYSWHEANILSMSPQRRNAYLQLIMEQPGQ